jgi:hyperosmotically inducible periplasmic protein
MKTINSIKLSAIAVSIAFSTAAFSASDLSTTDNDYDTITGWQTSLAAEFSRLDTSGNGLLMPLEASKGNAFNKKTFATADADGDGTIDQGEYIQYKTNMGVKDIPAATTMTNEPSSSSSMSDNSNIAKATIDEPVPTIQTADTSQKPTKNTVGGALDDSVITTKAKAAIFNTPNLKTLQISVETRKGEVLLSGFVDSEAAKMKAEEVVGKVDGVNSVQNSLEVKK